MSVLALVLGVMRAGPTRRRSGLASAVVTLGVLILLLAAVVFILRPLGSTPGNSGVGLIGPEGHREVSEVDGRTVIRETAHSTGAELLSSGPSGLIYMDSLMDKLGSPFARLIETRVGEGYLARTTTIYELSDEGARRVATHTTGTTIYSPGALELPADVAPGDTWESQGSATRIYSLGTITQDYTMIASASAPEDSQLSDAGCVLITQAITIPNFETEEPETTETTATWCPGRGVVEGTPTELPGLPPEAQLTSDTTLQPETWTAEPVDLLADPPLHWATNLPTVGTGEQLILAHSTSRDLLYAPRYDVSRAIRAHPGGTIVNLRRLGELVVASTTQAEVVGYDQRVIPVWTVQLADIVTVTPVLHRDQLIVMDGSGQLTALDPRTGAERWSQALRRQPAGELLSCGPLVLAPTTSAELVAITPDGDVAWTLALPENPTLTACWEDLIVTFVGDSLDVISQGGERIRSVVINDSALVDLHVQGETLVTSSTTGTTRYQLPTLRFLSRETEPLQASLLVDGHLIGLSEERLVVWNADGEEVFSDPTDIAPDHLIAQLSVVDDGVFVLGGDMRAVMWR